MAACFKCDGQTSKVLNCSFLAESTNVQTSLQLLERKSSVRSLTLYKCICNSVLKLYRTLLLTVYVFFDKKGGVESDLVHPN